MTKMVNSWNEWDPLKRVIVGRPEGTQVTAPEPGWIQDFPSFGFPARHLWTMASGDGGCSQ